MSVYSRKFQFLGLTLGKNGDGIFLRTHPTAPRKCKQKLKKLTRRNRGRNVRQVMEEVKTYIRGWLGYFYIAKMKRTLEAWNGWLRRRIRMYIWKQWKRPKTRVKALRKLGVSPDQAYQWGNTRLGLAHGRKSNPYVFHYRRKARAGRILRSPGTVRAFTQTALMRLNRRVPVVRTVV